MQHEHDHAYPSSSSHCFFSSCSFFLVTTAKREQKNRSRKQHPLQLSEGDTTSVNQQ